MLIIKLSEWDRFVDKAEELGFTKKNQYYLDYKGLAIQKAEPHFVCANNAGYSPYGDYVADNKTSKRLNSQKIHISENILILHIENYLEAGK